MKKPGIISDAGLIDCAKTGAGFIRQTLFGVPNRNNRANSFLFRFDRAR